MAKPFMKSPSWDGNILRPHMQEWERICVTFPYLMRVVFQLHLDIFSGLRQVGPKDIRRTHTISILLFSNAVGLG